jgi:hypothetical protein
MYVAEVLQLVASVMDVPDAPVIEKGYPDDATVG